MEEVKLNNQQQEAANLIKDWFFNRMTNRKQIFVLAGYAGTGKSFLINYLIKHVLELKSYQVMYAAPTGKAANVLIQKKCAATTIHRMIYTPVEKEKEIEVNGKKQKIRTIEFVKKKNIGYTKLIVLDEISMVSEKMMEDILSFNVPILACGDIGQLPAVAAKGHDLLKKPDYTLTDIVRQSEDNPIIKIATMARKGIDIPYGIYNGIVAVLNKNELTDDMRKLLLTKCDQVICGKNKTRLELNKEIRSYFGRESDYPVEGDKIICNENNYDIYLDDKCDYNLVNGCIGYVDKFEMVDPSKSLAKLNFTADFIKDSTEDVLVDAYIFKHNEYLYDKQQYAYLMSDGSYQLKNIIKKENKESFESYRNRLSKELKYKRKSIKTELINQFEYGYAISCHKSQGSEFDIVVVFDESEFFRGQEKKWLYTAITRAKKKLFIIR